MPAAPWRRAACRPLAAGQRDGAATPGGSSPPTTTAGSSGSPAAHTASRRPGRRRSPRWRPRLCRRPRPRASPDWAATGPGRRATGRCTGTGRGRRRGTRPRAAAGAPGSARAGRPGRGPRGRPGRGRERSAGPGPRPGRTSSRFSARVAVDLLRPPVADGDGAIARPRRRTGPPAAGRPSTRGRSGRSRARPGQLRAPRQLAGGRGAHGERRSRAAAAARAPPSRYRQIHSGVMPARTYSGSARGSLEANVARTGASSNRAVSSGRPSPWPSRPGSTNRSASIRHAAGVEHGAERDDARRPTLADERPVRSTRWRTYGPTMSTPPGATGASFSWAARIRRIAAMSSTVACRIVAWPAGSSRTLARAARARSGP